jgi:hypothetical protein
MANNTISLTFDTDSSLSQDEAQSLLYFLQRRLSDDQLAIAKFIGREVWISNLTGYCTTPWTPQSK